MGNVSVGIKMSPQQAGKLYMHREKLIEEVAKLKALNEELKYKRDILDMDESRENDVTRQAAILANALTDINNDIGEMKEVKLVFESVKSLVSMYAGLEDCRKDPDL